MKVLLIQWSYFSLMEHPCAVSQVFLTQDIIIHNQDWWPAEEQKGETTEIVSHSVEDNGAHHILCYMGGDITAPGHQHNMEQYLLVAITEQLVVQQKC